MTIDDLALTLHPELGCRTAIHLLECFGSAEAVFAASAGELVRRAELKPALARSLCRREYHQAAERELAFCERNRIRPVAAGDESYPRRLLECADYPHVIYLKGGPELSGGHWLSVVGTRKATPYGQKMCDRLIGELSALFPDLVVVSGLAYGIDVAAHRAAMQHGVRTVAVLGHPLTHIYPQAHTETARRIVSLGGTLISEYPSTARPDKAGFVQRNRLIAGLSDGTVIVESAARGGAPLSRGNETASADMAGGYHREVMAVPGRVGDRCAEGTNALIRSLKAQMVCSGADIAEILGWEAPAPSGKAVGQSLFAETGPLAPSVGNESAGATGAAYREAVLPDSVAASAAGDGRVASLRGLLGDDPVSLDELSIRSGIAVAELPALLLELELAGRICALPGNLYMKN